MIRSFSFKTRARQAQQAQLGTFWHNSVSPTSRVMYESGPFVLNVKCRVVCQASLGQQGLT